MKTDQESTRVHQLIVMWCCEGLECVLDYPGEERRETLAALKGEKYINDLPSLTALTLRARFNNQRHYEIYALLSTVPPGVIRDLFQKDPQAAADLIRDRGEKVYSDRLGEKTQVIT